MEGTMSAADIAAVTRPNIYGGYGMGDGIGYGGGLVWIVLLFALLGGNGFGANGRFATTEDLASGFNFSGVNNKLNEITAGIAGINQNLGNAICSSTYELASKIDNCCCTTQRAIDSVKFDMANYTAGINANTTAGIQKILDAISQNKIEALQAQVNKLELDRAFCGVVRYPTTTTYATACNPFAGYGACGCPSI